MNPEIKRYIEYLQGHLLTPGSERFHDHQAFLDKLRSYSGPLKVSRPPRTDAERALFEKWKVEAVSFQPDLKYDSYTARNIFKPLLDALLADGAAHELKINAPVHLVPSTDLSATPATRSSDGIHMLFVGLGTSCFCNYWAKAFAWLSTTCAKINTGPVSENLIKLALAADKGSVELSVRLTWYYRVFNTLAGFGTVAEPELAFHYRMELVSAMELFALGHELGHMWIAEQAETDATFEKLLNDPHGTELACDNYGFAVSRSVGSDMQNWSAFSGAGALCFLYAADWCTRPRTNDVEKASSHPDLETRRNNLIKLAFGNTAPEQRSAVASYLIDFKAYLEYLRTIVEEVLKSVSLPEPLKDS